MLDILIVPLLQVLLGCLRIYNFFILIYVFVSLFLAFGVLNRNNVLVFSLYNFLARLIEPVLTPIRRVIPTVGVFDLSLLVLCIGLSYFNNVLRLIILKYFPA